MDIRAEIAARVDKLPPDLQEQVLRFVSSLGTAPQAGQPGSALRRFSGYLDHGAAREMTEAIEEGCEQVDAVDW
jgi:hypothetical protein